MDTYYKKFFNSEPLNQNYPPPPPPQLFRGGGDVEIRDVPAVYGDDELPEQRIYFDEEDDFGFLPDDYGSGLPKDGEEIFSELKSARQIYQPSFQGMPDLNGNFEDYDDVVENLVKEGPPYLETNDFPKDVAGNGQPVMYTEGGMVYAPNSKNGGKQFYLLIEAFLCHN